MRVLIMHRRIAIAAVATLGLSAALATLPAVATGKKDVAPAAAPAPAPTPAPPAPTPAPARPQTSPAPAKTTPAPAPKDKKGKNDDGLAAPLTPAPDLASGPAAAPQDAVVGSAVVIGVAEGRRACARPRCGGVV